MKKATCAFLSAVTLAMFGAVAQENQSVNLVQNGDFSKAEDAKDMKRWRDGYCFMHDASIPANSPMRQDVKKAVKWEIKDGMAVIAKSPDLVKYCNGDEKIASGRECPADIPSLSSLRRRTAEIMSCRFSIR